MLRHAEHRAIVQPQPMHRERGELGHVDFDHLEFVERMVGERIGRVAGALELASVNASRSTIMHGVGRHILDVRLERRRIHRDQHVGLVAGGENFAAGKIKLEAADSGQRARGARISAGKSGSVAISLPASADSVVNCIPVNCIPSPESPANRITTRSALQMRLVRQPDRRNSCDSAACPAASGGTAISVQSPCGEKRD